MAVNITYKVAIHPKKMLILGFCSLHFFLYVKNMRQIHEIWYAFGDICEECKLSWRFSPTHGIGKAMYSHLQLLEGCQLFTWLRYCQKAKTRTLLMTAVGFWLATIACPERLVYLLRFHPLVVQPYCVNAHSVCGERLLLRRSPIGRFSSFRSPSHPCARYL